MLTTCLGFLSILQSPIPMIYDFGLMCLIGIVVCFVTALFLLTSVIYGMARLGGVKLGAVATTGRLEKAISFVAEGTMRRPYVVIVAILAMVIGYSLDPLVGVEIDTSTFAPQTCRRSCSSARSTPSWGTRRTTWPCRSRPRT